MCGVRIPGMDWPMRARQVSRQDGLNPSARFVGAVHLDSWAASKLAVRFGTTAPT